MYKFLLDVQYLYDETGLVPYRLETNTAITLIPKEKRKAV